MGSVPRPKPERLTEKLLQIRLSLGLSQGGMLKLLELDERLFSSAISGYETGRREPPLPILLKYARSVGVSTDALIDDELDLPAKIVNAAKREEARGRPASRPGRKR
jgi:transcriptional regulator with XRE-family HTH domain